MNIIILYATYSSGTLTVADSLVQALKTAGNSVEIKPISQVTFEEILPFDLRIFASPSWDDKGKDGQPHIDFISFMQKSAGKSFADKPCAIFGLGDSSYLHFCGAVDVLEEFVKKSGGKLITPSFKIDNYFMDMDGNNQKLADWAGKLVA